MTSPDYNFFLFLNIVSSSLQKGIYCGVYFEWPFFNDNIATVSAPKTKH